MYNIGSLVLGLAAWVIPLFAIGKNYRFALCCIGSLSCCAISLLFQLLEVQNRVHINDWSALLDTIDAVILATVVLFCGVIVTNLIALFGFNRLKR